MSETRPRPQHRCALCIFRSYTYRVLRAHCKLVHPHLKLPKISPSLKSQNAMNSKQCFLPVRGKVTSHCETTKFKCRKCGNSFSTKNKLKYHIQSHYGKKQRCNLCSFTTLRIDQLYLHIKSVHGTLKQFQCDLCEARFTTAPYLKRHTKNVHSSKRYQCDICLNIYSTKPNLKQHKKEKHSGKKVSMSCQKCDKTYTSMWNLRTHIRLQHSIHEKYSWKCLICGVQFTRRHGLTDHMQRKHSDKRPIFKCTICSVVYQSEGGLRRHNKIKHTMKDKSYQCQTCFASLFTGTALNRHLKTHSLENKTVKCGHCSKTFYDKSDLSNHQYTHGKTNKYECTLCNVKCRHPKELRNHLKSHLNVKSVKCVHQGCDKLFSTKRTMLWHWREIHLNMKREKCPVCGHICLNHGQLTVSFFAQYRYLVESAILGGVSCLIKDRIWNPKVHVFANRKGACIDPIQNQNKAKLKPI